MNNTATLHLCRQERTQYYAFFWTVKSKCVGDSEKMEQ